MEFDWVNNKELLRLIVVRDFVILAHASEHFVWSV